jgi:WD40 repeat protein
VASGSYDETVKLWDASTGALRSTLTGHKKSVISVAFSSDGQTVASGSYDETVKLWDASTGQILDTMTAGGYIDRISFSKDGLHLLTNRGAFSSYALPKVTSDGATSLAEIAVGASWISWKGSHLLWLPPEYRSDIVAVHDSSFVLGQPIGRVTLVSFNRSFPLEL